MGDNLTGVARARERCEAMLAGNAEFAPAPVLDDETIAEVRQQYAEEGEPLGTVPPPASFRQAAKTAAGVIKPGNPMLFVDKLAARLAFERSGVRLYQALLSKVSIHGNGASGDIRSGVESVLKQEFEHFVLLKRVIEEKMGGDATTVTPSADVEATLSSGVLAVLVDPRTDLVQSLEAILVAELADNESWDQLVELSRAQANDEITASFEHARDQERTHLGIIRMLIERARPSA
jgi:rubrerythrin